MSFPRYPEYKDSGVEWLGEVPAHWDVVPLKRSFSVIGGSTPKSENADYWDGDVVWVTPSDLSKLDAFEIYDSQRKITQDGLASCGTTLVPKESIVLSTRAPIGSIGIAGTELCINQGCKVLVPSSVAYSRFYTYLLSIATNELNIRGKGTTFLELSADELGGFRVTLPLRQEQSCITSFLDRETAKIDELISEQEKLIALLKEKRQAVISHAVTKGLDPSVKMKDSGIEWLGDVPGHWEVCGLKRMCSKITDGAHISPETEGGAYPFVSTKDVRDDSIDFDECLMTSPETYFYMLKTGCQPEKGDVLFSKDGTIGRTVIVRKQVDFVIASSLIIIRPNQSVLDPEFLNFLCQSKIVSMQVEMYVKGAGLPRLSITNLTKVFGVFPPIEEQHLIAQSLFKASREFNELTDEALNGIELLKERRSALISAAVTGKIDVRRDA